MSFSRLPQDVINHEIFPYLNVKDLSLASSTNREFYDERLKFNKKTIFVKAIINYYKETPRGSIIYGRTIQLDKSKTLDLNITLKFGIPYELELDEMEFDEEDFNFLPPAQNLVITYHPIYINILQFEKEYTVNVFGKIVTSKGIILLFDGGNGGVINDYDNDIGKGTKMGSILVNETSLKIFKNNNRGVYNIIEFHIKDVNMAYKDFLKKAESIDDVNFNMYHQGEWSLLFGLKFNQDGFINMEQPYYNKKL